MLANDNYYFLKAIELWGLDSQLDMLSEECGELIADINRFKRGRIDVNKFIEELVDVEMMIEEFKAVVISHISYEKIKNQKWTKFRGQVDKAMEEKDSGTK